MLAGLLAGCGDSGSLVGGRPSVADQVAESLEALPGVVDAEAERIVQDETEEELNVDIEVSDEATAEQISRALTLAIDAERDLDYPMPLKLGLMREGQEDGHAQISLFQEADVRADELAALFVTAEESLGDDVSWQVDQHGRLDVALPLPVAVDDITAVLDRVESDPDLRAIPRWEIWHDSRSGSEPGSSRLVLEAGLTPEVRALWDGAAARVRESNGLVVATQVRPRNDPSISQSDPPPPGSLSLTMYFDADIVDDTSAVTVDRFGDRLLPEIRKHLDLIRDLPAATYAGDLGRPFVVAENGARKPGQVYEELSQSWSRLAHRYLNG